ncbi:MAG: division/cell wall cluster transcriptional repressor MraZ [Candidatus Omnitrophica bacterium]|nr:division/cell wall cluster transcriptional repressor MraZ [Candidatus Omnitrophota bacterium]
MWYGEYLHSLDDKNRFVLPSKFRQEIKKEKIRKFYFARGLDGCLFMFAEEDWKKLEERFKSLSFTKKQARFFNRLYFSGAYEISPDSQGRVLIPDYLREFAGIAKDIVIVGISDRIEIWDKDRWHKFYEQNQKNFEEMAENIFD